MALTVFLALAGALVLALPSCRRWSLSSCAAASARARTVVMRAAEARLSRRRSRWALRRRVAVVGRRSPLLAGIAASLATRLGSEFVPKLDEGDDHGAAAAASPASA